MKASFLPPYYKSLGLTKDQLAEVKKVQATLFQLVEDEEQRLARDERQGRP